MAYGRQTTPDEQLVSSHRVTLVGLSPATTYHLRALSRDAAGNRTNSVDVAMTTPAAFLILAADTGRNLSMFKAVGTAQSVQTPIPQSGFQTSFMGIDLGEMHFANGRAFVLVTAGMPGGGLHVVNTAGGTSDTFSLPSTLTGLESRPSHASLDPEGKFLWVHNDGPIDDPGADSVFRVNVNPADTNVDTGYLTSVEILVGNGHQTGVFSRPDRSNPRWREMKKLVVISSRDEQRLDVIDDDSTHTETYGTVIKVIRGVGASPHAMAFSPASGRIYVGLTDGGMLVLDTLPAGIFTDPDVDLSLPDWPDWITLIPAGTGDGEIPRAGYTHVSRDGTTVFTVGYDSAAGMGYLSAVDATDQDRVIKVLELGNVAVGSIDEKPGDKLYLPSTNAGSEHAVIQVVDIADPASPDYLTLLRTITVGEAGEVRDGEISFDGTLAVYPDTCSACDTVRVIDTKTDRVIDTLTLPGPTATTVGMVMVPFTSKDNH
jgi:DNA-binding beta-propeller fold protein YncE